MPRPRGVPGVLGEHEVDTACAAVDAALSRGLNESVPELDRLREPLSNVEPRARRWLFWKKAPICRINSFDFASMAPAVEALLVAAEPLIVCVVILRSAPMAELQVLQHDACTGLGTW